MIDASRSEASEKPLSNTSTESGEKSTQNSTEPNANDADSKSNISYAQYRKLLDEKKKYESKAKEYEAAETSRKERELAEQGRFKELLDQKEKELGEAKRANEEQRRVQEDQLRFSSVIESLGVPIDRKWHVIVPYDQVKIKDDGTVDEVSLNAVVNSIKLNYPEIMRPHTSSLPKDSPSGGVKSKISKAAYMKLPLSEMRKWSHNDIED